MKAEMPIEKLKKVVRTSPPKVQKPLILFIQIVHRLTSICYYLIACPRLITSIMLLRFIKVPEFFGTPIPRYYWRDHLLKNKSYIRGDALEIGTTSTVRYYGGNAINKADAIDVVHGPDVSIIGDLSDAWVITDESYDVFVNQFTMHVLRDDLSALYHSIRVLKPHGKLICNFPCVSGYFFQGLSYGDIQTYIYRWYTPAGVKEMLNELSVSPADYTMNVYGNLYGYIAYLFGITAEALPRRWLRNHDPGRPVLVCITVTKPENW